MRSRLAVALEKAISKRKSRAVGWRRAMMEDPRTISASLDLLFLAKAIERIGDHSKNVAELIIYLVEGKDVRHQTMAEIESAVL